MSGHPRHTLVVGVDGSTSSRDALRWAVTEAARCGDSVLAVTTWTFDLDAAPMVGPNPAETAASAVEKLRKAVTETAAAVAGAPLVRQLVTEGPAGRVLVEAASGARMLIVGSHGYGAIRSALLGSVSTYCLRHATCPVLVIPAMPSADTDPGLALMGDATGR